jgi:hypothetical protein
MFARTAREMTREGDKVTFRSRRTFTSSDALEMDWMVEIATPASTAY